MEASRTDFKAKQICPASEKTAGLYERSAERRVLTGPRARREVALDALMRVT